ncbi:MAG TPA: NUDIX domain-containing protein [Ignavibacteriaceae bacterium]|nr:NUDIX domain-containing protein [Ignavibacteriaceae bacterium]
MNIISNMIEVHLFRRDKKKIEFLILKRAKDQVYPNIWQMVTGKIKENETAKEAAIREIKEETGFLPISMWVVPNVNSFYSPQKDEICLIPVLLAEVENISKVVISDEHSNYRWVNYKKAKSLFAWPGQKRSLEIIDEYLTKKKSLLKFVRI